MHEKQRTRFERRRRLSTSDSGRTRSRKNASWPERSESKKWLNDAPNRALEEGAVLAPAAGAVGGDVAEVEAGVPGADRLRVNHNWG